MIGKVTKISQEMKSLFEYRKNYYRMRKIDFHNQRMYFNLGKFASLQ